MTDTSTGDDQDDAGMQQNQPPENSPYDTSEAYLASLLLNELRKPESVRDEDDRDRIIELGERLAREVDRKHD